MSCKRHLRTVSRGLSTQGHNNWPQSLTEETGGVANWARHDKTPDASGGRRVIICGKQKGEDRASLSVASRAHISGLAGLKTPESH